MERNEGINPQVKATARIQVTVELETQSTWGNDCTVDQVFSQAAREGKLKLIGILKSYNVRIINEPHVTMVLADKF